MEMKKQYAITSNSWDRSKKENRYGQLLWKYKNYGSFTVYLSYDPAMLYQSTNPGETFEKDIPNVIHYNAYFFLKPMLGGTVFYLHKKNEY